MKTGRLFPDSSRRKLFVTCLKDLTECSNVDLLGMSSVCFVAFQALQCKIPHLYNLT